MTYCIFSEDKRMLKIKELLEKDNNRVIVHTKENYKNADVLILPVPVTIDGVHIKDSDIVIEELRNFSGKILGGLVPEKFDFIEDYFKNEEVEIANAVPTSEAAVEIAIRETKKTLLDSTVLITGFGRISKILSKILKGFDCKIKIAARNKTQLAYIKALGFEAVDIYNMPADCDILINTVPAQVINSEYINKLKKDVVIIDLASMPGGCDFKECEKCKIKAIHALSLPAKSAPDTAGEILYNSIKNFDTKR